MIVVETDLLQVPIGQRMVLGIDFYDSYYFLLLLLLFIDC